MIAKLTIAIDSKNSITHVWPEECIATKPSCVLTGRAGRSDPAQRLLHHRLSCRRLLSACVCFCSPVDPLPNGHTVPGVQKAKGSMAPRSASRHHYGTLRLYPTYLTLPTSPYLPHPTYLTLPTSPYLPYPSSLPYTPPPHSLPLLTVCS